MDKEVELIEDLQLKEDVKSILNKLPMYFWDVSASSTGKYHPDYACSEHGLVKHTKAAVRIAYDLLNLEQCGFNQLQKDIVIASLIVHDGLKSGWKYGYTAFEHPLYMKEFILENKAKHELHSEDSTIALWADCVASHMGQWNTSSYSNVILPKPVSELQQFVHMCDFLASRKYLEVPFNDECEVKF